MSDLKEQVLLEITGHPGLYADEIAERLKMSTMVAIELTDELLQEGLLEFDKDSK